MKYFDLVLLGELRNTYKILVRKSKSKEHLSNPRHSCRNCIVKEIWYIGVNWIYLAEDSGIPWYYVRGGVFKKFS
jgi:hypothetical protein